MFAYDFMRTAFLAGGVVAIVAGSVGFFLVLRNLTFAGHALSHIGFAGATGSVLLGISAFWGLLAFTLAAAVAMGLLGDRLRQRDVAVGIVLALALGLGVLFLYLYTTSASEAMTILFGNLLGVGLDTFWGLFALGLGALAALSVVSRPLLFATLAPELAEAKGVSPRLLSVLFLMIVAVAVAEAAQVVGVLLVFALMVGPAAAALRLAAGLRAGIMLSVVLALVETWGGLALAYWTDWPTTFWIVLASCLVYFVSCLKQPGAGAAAAGAAGAPVADPA